MDTKEIINLDEKQRDEIKDLMFEKYKSRIPWVQRKEISAWAAIILY